MGALKKRRDGVLTAGSSLSATSESWRAGTCCEVLFLKATCRAKMHADP